MNTKGNDNVLVLNLQNHDEVSPASRLILNPVPPRDNVPSVRSELIGESRRVNKSTSRFDAGSRNRFDHRFSPLLRDRLDKRTANSHQGRKRSENK